MRDRCFVMFSSPGISLDQAAELFPTPHWLAARVEDCLLVQFGESQQFRITLSMGPEVLAESAEIGRQAGHVQALEHCDQRFEIEIDDLDSALDEINTLMEIQGFLQDATEGFLFTCWNENLLPPES